ncbi:MAG TPA: hypothetical protein VL244_05100 [Alphaproteobacteria bacterium]|nr:hypothetical protein [Alphaproteobacteria bacterium]
MASFEREEILVRHLLARLGLSDAATDDPNVAGKETGIDVAVRLTDGRTIGVQVTEVDPHTLPGTARAQEKAIAKTTPGKPYGMWGQNDPVVVLDALARAITRKAAIAAKHSFDEYKEVWLLLCGGIPEHGAAVSSFIMTPWLSAENLNSATDSLLQGSKYDGCFFLPVLGAEQAFYPWNKPSRWEKRVKLDDIRDVPRAAYVNSLMNTAEAGDWQEVERLCDEECRAVLAEVRQKP